MRNVPRKKLRDPLINVLIPQAIYILGIVQSIRCHEKCPKKEVKRGVKKTN
jgi:hypothetical protein